MATGLIAKAYWHAGKLEDPRREEWQVPDIHIDAFAKLSETTTIYDADGIDAKRVAEAFQAAGYDAVEGSKSMFSEDGEEVTMQNGPPPFADLIITPSGHVTIYWENNLFKPARRDKEKIRIFIERLLH